MANIAYWVLHIMGGLFAFVMSAISGRATVTVLFVLAVEFMGLIGGTLPGGANIGFTVEFFGGLGLIAGVPLAIGRGRLDWWFLPALAAGTFVVLRLPLFFEEHAPGKALLWTVVSAIALGGGILAGHGLVALTWLGRTRPKRMSP
jgi:hypothetical protein